MAYLLYCELGLTAVSSEQLYFCGWKINLQKSNFILGGGGGHGKRVVGTLLKSTREATAIDGHVGEMIHGFGKGQPRFSS